MNKKKFEYRLDEGLMAKEQLPPKLGEVRNPIKKFLTEKQYREYKKWKEGRQDQ